MPKPHIYYKPLSGDDFIDEVRVIVRERYKTSGLSGDEWRFHRVIQFYRKGHLMGEQAFNGHTATVLAFAPWWLTEMSETGQFDAAQKALGEGYCMQPGCPEQAVSEYELIEEFGPQGQKLDRADYDFPGRSVRRRFCRRHLHRGDCDREDSDANYRVISGPGPADNDWSGARISEAQQVTVQVDRLDDIPDAIAKVKQELRGDA